MGLLFLTSRRGCLIITQVNSTSVKKLHNLYLNAAQRLFYEKVSNEDIQEEQLAAFIYKKCISVFLDSQQHIVIITFFN